MPVPFHGEEFTFHNPDGSEIRVRGWGNQFHAVFETPDGYTVVKDPDSGFFDHARLSDDGAELMPTDARAGTDLVALGIPPHLRVKGPQRNGWRRPPANRCRAGRAGRYAASSGRPVNAPRRNPTPHPCPKRTSRQPKR